jgi:hypothetical protein
MKTKTAPRMEWTGEVEADALVARDPLALLIGFCLDQQIPVEKAFVGPLEIQRRFPASMAGRVQALCSTVANDYGNDATAIWAGVKDAAELQRRLRALPGFGEMKARIVLGVLVKHLGVKPQGWPELVPDFPTLADVHTVAERERYQAGKRAHKAAMRSQATAAPAKGGQPVG